MKFLSDTGFAYFWTKVKQRIESVAIPRGAIMIWSGTSYNIPSGWALCDGSNGTPDLVDRFVLGTSTGSGIIGGSKTVKLTEEQMPWHTHGVLSGWGADARISIDRSNVVLCGDGGTQVVRQSVVDASGSGQPHDNMPPYYALCYIMKL